MSDAGIVTGIVLKVTSYDVCNAAARKLSVLQRRYERIKAVYDKAVEIDKQARADNVGTEDEEPVAVTMSSKVRTLGDTLRRLEGDIEMLKAIGKWGVNREFYWLSEHEMRELGLIGGNNG